MMAAFPSIFQTKYLPGPTKQTCSYAVYSVENCSIYTKNLDFQTEVVFNGGGRRG
jgi:predicted choloylglycine hydrolase